MCSLETKTDNCLKYLLIHLKIITLLSINIAHKYFLKKQKNKTLYFPRKGLGHYLMFCKSLLAWLNCYSQILIFPSTFNLLLHHILCNLWKTSLYKGPGVWVRGRLSEPGS